MIAGGVSESFYVCLQGDAAATNVDRFAAVLAERNQAYSKLSLQLKEMSAKCKKELIEAQNERRSLAMRVRKLQVVCSATPYCLLQRCCIVGRQSGM